MFSLCHLIASVGWSRSAIARRLTRPLSQSEINFKASLDTAGIAYRVHVDGADPYRGPELQQQLDGAAVHNCSNGLL